MPHRTAAGVSSRSRLSADELAVRIGVSRTRVERLAHLGLIDPDRHGKFAPGDVHRVRLLVAFEDAGVPVEALVRADRAGAISFRYYDELHQPPGAASPRLYRDFGESLGSARHDLPRLFAALGLAEPDPGTRLSVDDEEVIRELLEIAAATRHPDLALRTLRVLSEATRRAAEAAHATYGEALERDGGDLAGLRPDATFDRLIRPWAHLARAFGRVAAWLATRHLSDAIDEYSVIATERVLEQEGYVPRSPEALPAVAFVDLTGFTRYAEERGDDAAAAIALRLNDLATQVAREHRGRVVKLLGDGVLMTFANSRGAVGAAVELVAQLADSGLPPGHAGVHAGPVINRDGDVFGRAVNLASRVADVAPPGAVFATEVVARGLPRHTTEPVTTKELQGIGAVTLYRILSSDPPGSA